MKAVLIYGGFCQVQNFVNEEDSLVLERMLDLKFM